MRTMRKPIDSYSRLAPLRLSVSTPRAASVMPRSRCMARLRASKTDDNPLYLRTHMEAGHGGASGRFEHMRETAIGYAFAVACAVSQ